MPKLPELLRWLLGITRPVHPPLLASLLCRVLNLSLDLALFATATGGVVNLLVNGGSIWTLLAILLGLALLKALCYYFEQFLGHYVAFKALELLRAYVFSKLWPKAPAVVTQSRSGDVLASLTRDVDRIEVVYAHTFAPVVSAYLVGIGASLTAGFWLGWDVVWVAVLCLALALLVVPYLGIRRALRSTQGVLESRRDLAHHLTDSVFGLDEVVGYGREADRLAELDELGMRVSRLSAQPRAVRAWRRGANLFLTIVATLSVIWLGQGTLSAVAVAALAGATLRVFEGPRGVEDALGYLDHSLSAARRLWTIAHAPERVSDGPVELNLTEPPLISFDRVSYTYPSTDGRADEPAVTEISFEVEPGSHTTLVGRSGSGKSTLMQLLQRYDDPGEGQILLDGRPLPEFTLDSLRRHVVAVSQKNQLLQGSVAQNLRLGAPDATDEELWAALHTACLDEDIRALPDGLETSVGRAKTALSGGQVQRLCLARALLLRPRVLILDEFAASLNVDLEEQIRHRLDQWPDPLTLIEVTHRLRATENADQIIMLDRGQIIRRGSGAELSADKLAQLFLS
ncbi:ABC transporter ATP-binding protein [Scrofimicrobium sp. R131]|uniref:ABC transporter ATP-binding protein n=1 Tax=Scrofimicrobium appendicitidis TaxID=3079930 RepID=A0AAU7V8B2_9ACTO